MPDLALILDDDRDTLTGLESLFEKLCGLHTASASTIAEARAILATRRPRYFVIDIHLPKAAGDPEENGLDFVREVREAMPAAKILVASGDVDDRVRSEAHDAGADAVLTKPLSADMVLAAIVPERDNRLRPYDPGGHGAA